MTYFVFLNVPLLGHLLGHLVPNFQMMNVFHSGDKGVPQTAIKWSRGPKWGDGWVKISTMVPVQIKRGVMKPLVTCLKRTR